MSCEVALERFKEADKEFWRIASEVAGLEKSLTPTPGVPRTVVVTKDSPESTRLDELRSQRDEAYQRFSELGRVWGEATKAHRD